MKESDKDAEIKALKEALKKERAKNASLKKQHVEDKRSIKNLKHRKDPSQKSKKKDKQEVAVEKITKKERQLLLIALPDIDILSLLSD